MELIKGLALLCVFTLFIAFRSEAVETLRLNQIQIKGTHNSYHIKPRIAFDKSHKYSHLPLYEQLDERGIRAFELDVHKSGKGVLEVYHIAVIDNRSTCDRFSSCLQELKRWSDDYPGHSPVFVWIEIKDSTGGKKINDFSEVDRVIKEVLAERLITPGDLQGNFPTLQTAIQEKGWPTIAEASGKFMFILDSDKRAYEHYLRADSLQGRVMFYRAKPEDIDKPWAVVTKTGPGDFHSQALEKNFIVAQNLCSAKLSEKECLDKLETSRAAGTHLLMDDFEGGSPAQSHGSYFVKLLSSDTVDCNPVVAENYCP